jgi:hypothetical protein
MRPRQKLEVKVVIRPQTEKEFLAFRQALRLFLFELARKELRAAGGERHDHHSGTHGKKD